MPICFSCSCFLDVLQLELNVCAMQLKDRVYQMLVAQMDRNKSLSNEDNAEVAT